MLSLLFSSLYILPHRTFFVSICITRSLCLFLVLPLYLPLVDSSVSSDSEYILFVYKGKWFLEETPLDTGTLLLRWQGRKTSITLAAIQTDFISERASDTRYISDRGCVVILIIFMLISIITTYNNLLSVRHRDTTHHHWSSCISLMIPVVRTKDRPSCPSWRAVRNRLIQTSINIRNESIAQRK